MSGEATKAESSVECRRALVLGIDDDGKHRQRPPGAENASDRIRQKQITEAATTHPLVPRQPPDQSGRNRIVPWQLTGDLLWQILEGEGERTQTVETDYTERIIGRDEYPRHVTPLVLPRPAPKPIIEFGLTAGECRPIVVLAERLNDDAHVLSP